MIDNEEIEIIDNGAIEYLQFKRLLKAQDVFHIYIMKSHDMNFRIGKGFRLIEQVKKNLKLVCENSLMKYETIIRPDYDHTNNVDCVNYVDNNKEIPELRGERFICTDGLITDKKDITLMSTNADCLLILLYDPVKKVIGNIHAGWRGSFGKISKNAIEKMVKEYDCNPKDIEAYFLPSIRKCHFEVDEDVKELCEKEFNYTGRINEIIEKGEIKDNKQKYLIDTCLINKIILMESGLDEKNIIDSRICSVCNKDKIHSRRAEGENFGLGAAFIALYD